MNKFLKRMMSVSMVLCVLLQSFVCNAGPGNKRRGKERKREEKALDSSTTEDIQKQMLDNLCCEVNTILRGNPCEVIPLTDSLKEQCDEYEESEEVINDIIASFSMFLARWIRGEGSSTENIYNGLITFLSLIKRFQEVDIRSDSKRDLCCCVALLTLEMCKLRCKGVSELWYRLMVPHITEKFKKFKTQFDRETKDPWIRKIRTMGFDPIKHADVAICTSDFFHDFGDDRDIAYLKKMVALCASPLGEAELRMNRAMGDLYEQLSPQSLAKAEAAFRRFSEEVSKYIGESVSPAYVQKEKLKSMLDDRRCELEQARKMNLVSESYKSALDVLNTVMQKMEEQKSPEAIEEAKKAVIKCRQLRDFYSKCQLQFSYSGRDWGEFLNECDVKIKRCAVQQCIDATCKCRGDADAHIEALCAEYSDDVFKLAMNAQEQYRQALAKCPPDSVIFDPRFEELRQHFQNNQEKILAIKGAHETKIANEELERKRKEKLEVRKIMVECDRQKKELQKRYGKGASKISEGTEPYEIVFYHDPTISNPLQFLEDNSGYIKEWNDWYNNARAGKFYGSPITLNKYIRIYEKKDDVDMGICAVDGVPRIYKYRGGISGKKSGFRIIFYEQQSSNRVVILYVGKPFGGRSHDEAWKTLDITKAWIYEPVGELIAKESFRESPELEGGNDLE